MCYIHPSFFLLIPKAGVSQHSPETQGESCYQESAGTGVPPSAGWAGSLGAPGGGQREEAHPYQEGLQLTG